MKRRKVIIVILTLMLLLPIAAGIILLWSTKPQYEGQLTIPGLREETSIWFDEYGIPHVRARNSEDAFFALGYLIARERLFQMDLLRRAGSGRLSEFFGTSFTQVDVFFRHLGIAEHARQSEKIFLDSADEALKHETIAFLNGINTFINHGHTPIEYLLPGIHKKPFTLQDIFCITGYMAFTFAEALRTDPILQTLLTEKGQAYCRPFLSLFDTSSVVTFSGDILSLVESLPYFPLAGSNAWAVAPARSASGKPLFANDTHIGYSQPCVWYEAHLEYPGMSIYGHFLPGFPFPLVGHTRHHAWGLTMLENDDMDFYLEELNSDSTHYRTGEQWVPLKWRTEIIVRKNATDTLIRIGLTHNGPLIHSFIRSSSEQNSRPVTLWWLFTQFPNQSLHVARLLMHARNLQDMNHACRQAVAPGLNIIYADTTGNIAWWTAGLLLKRAVHQPSALFIDGTRNENTRRQFYPFEENPCEINPDHGFVVSANRLPDSLLNLHPGYYAPSERTERIRKLLSQNKYMTISVMKQIQTDLVNERYASMAQMLAETLRSLQPFDVPAAEEVLRILESWNGSHELNEQGPVVFYKFLSELLDNTIGDEMDSVAYLMFKTSHRMKNAYAHLLFDETLPWWDDKRTNQRTEHREDILRLAFQRTCQSLVNQLGPVPVSWTWERVHILTHQHALAKYSLLRHLLNVGPYPAAGGNETINCSGFPVTSDGIYRVSYGPAMRIVIDLANMYAGECILPTGQSGHFLSRHYDDQADIYLKGQYRKMLFASEEINTLSRALKMIPQKQ